MCEFPFDLEPELGEVCDSEELCPGVHYLRAEGGEYYAVAKDAPMVSNTTKTYGRPSQTCPDLLLYPLDRPDGGWMTVRYEVCKYLLRRGLPLPEGVTLRDAALFGAECHPEYFGMFPAPVSTPFGETLRYLRLANGIYWLETDRCLEGLAVSSPIWDGELSEAAWRAALGFSGGENPPRYLFFSEKGSCIPIFELMKTRPDWERSGIIDSAALMNAIWQDFPAYAFAYNTMEQAGQNDLPGTVLNSLGGELETSRRPERTIRLTPGAGTDFLRKDRCHG